MSDTDDLEARYADILRRIEGRRQSAIAPQHGDLSGVLDGLNAMGFLDDMRKKRLRSVSMFGPRVFKGQIARSDDTHQLWVAAVAWYKPRGYYHYQTINLLGIWGIQLQAATHIIIATKPLEFDAPVFNPESYNRHLKSSFEMYYRGDAAPPPQESWLYSVPYNPAERLAIREAVQSTLSDWAAGLPKSD
jgi:hypothetical protein